MSKIKDIVIDNVTIGNSCPTYYIADIAANHDGDIERAISEGELVLKKISESQEN